MIKGIIGYKVLSYKDVEPILMQLRSHRTQDLLKQARSVVMGTARVTAYRSMPTVEWR
jgi:hypothetical protein